MSSTVHQLGRYPVEALLGTGGFATVYRARDDRLGDVVAVKVLAENHALDPSMRERFITEGCVLRRASHPNLIAVHDLGETERGQPFLVLEYADRGDLGRRLRELRLAGYRPDEGDVRAVVTAAAAAIEALHALSVVHRDLSPANLLLRSDPSRLPDQSGPAVVGADERLLLADLGLCKDLARHSGLTAGGGTDGFCAPEQRRGPCTVDARADLWALSALVVWLYTGHPPEAAGAWRQALVGGGAPAPLVRALERGLAEDPDDRPTSVVGWRAAVLDALSGPRVGVPAGVTSGGAPAAPRRRRSVVVALGLLAVVLAVAVGVTAGVRWPVGGAEGATVVRPADGGLVRATAERGATSVAIVGPVSVAVGNVARFRAEVRGAGSWVWLAPDGVVHADVRELAVTAVTPGEALVHLAAVAADGRTVEATLPLRVESRSR